MSEENMETVKPADETYSPGVCVISGTAFFS
jgi:hypothetical protein